MSDIKGDDLLDGDTIGMKWLIADGGYDANRLRATLREQGTTPSSPTGVTASAPSSTTSPAIRTAGPSKPCSVASRTFTASRPVMTNSSRHYASTVAPAAVVAFWC